MKKFLFGVFALSLVATSAFAEFNIGAYVFGNWTVLSGVSEDKTTTTGGVTTYDQTKNELKSGFSYNGRITASGQTEDGKFGGVVRVNAAPVWYSPAAYAYGWWKPLDILKFQIGRNPDGDYSVANIVAWGFTAGAGDVINALKANNLANAFFDGFGGQGVSLAVTPTEGLGIKLWVPVSGDFINPSAKEGHTSGGDYMDFGAQLTYDIAGIGTAAVTYQGGTGLADKDPLTGLLKAAEGSYAHSVTKYGDPGMIYASFLLTAVENLQVNFGVRYALPISIGSKDYPNYDNNGVGTGTKIQINEPIQIGLGAQYDMGDFGVKAALNFSFLGDIANGGKDGDPDKLYDAEPIPYQFNFAVLPYYNLGILKAFLSAGLNLVTDQENSDKQNVYPLTVGWYVNPYIQKSMGSGSFYAGFSLKGTPIVDKEPTYKGDSVDKQGSWKTQIDWAIPIGLEVSF
jgi:hypothetical protein